MGWCGWRGSGPRGGNISRWPCPHGRGAVLPWVVLPLVSGINVHGGEPICPRAGVAPSQRVAAVLLALAGLWLAARRRG